ncbi:unnamed protein product [Urochloa humidicola]
MRNLLGIQNTANMLTPYPLPSSLGPGPHPLSLWQRGASASGTCWRSCKQPSRVLQNNVQEGMFSCTNHRNDGEESCSPAPAAEVSLDRQLQAWRNNPTWTDEPPEVKAVQSSKVDLLKLRVEVIKLYLAIVLH